MSSAAIIRDDYLDNGGRRREERSRIKGVAVAQIVDTQDADLEGATFHCDIIDVSPCGMRLQTDRQIDHGKLDLWIEVDGHEGKMFLSTNIRWALLDSSAGSQLGVEIIVNPLSDVDQWC